MILLNDIKLSLRSLKDKQMFVWLNTLGFSIGLAVFMIITLFVYNEFSVDTKYSEYEQLYRVLEDRNNAFVDYKASDIFNTAFPEIEEACPVYQSSKYEFIIETKNKQFATKSFISTDNTFFKVFGIRPIALLSESVFPDKKSIVLTKSTAQQLFGDADALGQKLKFMNITLIVSAIIPDFTKSSSHHADFIVNIENNRTRFHKSNKNGHFVKTNNLYVKLSVGTDVKSLAHKINKYMPSHLPTVSKISFQPMHEVYLSSDVKTSGSRKGSMKTIVMFMSIAFIIILLSIINFIQFSISHHVSHIKSIGLKMFNGATKRHIFQQYLIDTAIVLLLALVFAIVLLQLFIPLINPLLSNAVNMHDILQWPFIVALLSISVIIIGIGAYLPLFVISRTDIKHLLSASSIKPRNPLLKGILPTLQFTAAIVLLICTLTIQKQLSFVKQTDLGFSKHNLLQINKPNGFNKEEMLKQRITNLPGVESAAWSYGSPAFIQYYLQRSESGEAEMIAIGVDKDFLRTFDIELLNGREFRVGDLEKSCYVNEAFMKMKNWTKPEDYLNQKASDYSIIGVVNDFHCNSLHETIIPTVLFLSETTMSTLNIKFSDGNVHQHLSEVEAVWKELIPEEIFNYKFYDEVFDNMYKREEKLGKALSLFAFIAFFITAMGLLGLVIQVTISCTKEIGIRKVNGATISEILLMLNKDFIKWVAIAFVIAVPIANYAMSKWLENFAYKTELSWWIFALAGVVALGIAMLTVSWQSWRAAQRNPVESLRYE